MYGPSLPGVTKDQRTWSPWIIRVALKDLTNQEGFSDFTRTNSPQLYLGLGMRCEFPAFQANRLTYRLYRNRSLGHATPLRQRPPKLPHTLRYRVFPDRMTLTLITILPAHS